MKIEVSIFLAGVLILMLTNSKAHSLIPPTPENELKKHSDLIAVGYVIGTVLVDVSNDGRWETRVYHSWVVVEKVIKGKLKGNQTIVVRWNDYNYIGKERNIVGGPSDISVYPGSKMLLYLTMDSETGVYHATGEWNSAKVIVPGFHTLPSKPGRWVVVRE